MKAKTLLKKLETDHPEDLTSGEMFLANADLLPVPDSQRTWNHLSFVSTALTRVLTIGLVLDRRLVQPQHLRHRILDDYGWPQLVASLPVSKPLSGYELTSAALSSDTALCHHSWFSTRDQAQCTASSSPPSVAQRSVSSAPCGLCSTVPAWHASGGVCRHGLAANGEYYYCISDAVRG